MTERILVGDLVKVKEGATFVHWNTVDIQKLNIVESFKCEIFKVESEKFLPRQFILKLLDHYSMSKKECLILILEKDCILIEKGKSSINKNPVLDDVEITRFKIGDIVKVNEGAIIVSSKIGLIRKLASGNFRVVNIEDLYPDKNGVREQRLIVKSLDDINGFGVLSSDCVFVSKCINDDRETAINDFRRLWKWISKDSTRKKEDWPEWKTNGGTVSLCVNNCPLCKFTERTTDTTNCNLCPIEWPKISSSDYGSNKCKMSFFGSWLIEQNPEMKKLYARIISELPEKK